ncbi:HNH endonuclease [Microbacterium sp. cf046]|uniref:HNH endonuclease signature motif containing protein n=1 Tax=Microbacterium sp. cf046 TaxID=1761803 RepID=UPI0008F3FCD9|nr:DUF222 domain-containing protein [Microbacterium sp. cf046]SFS02467.1 HNH endonuclease [Microbacterium sp. cf046]
MNDLIDDTSDPLAGIDEAVAALRAAWAVGGEGSLPPVSALKGSQLIAVNEAMGLLRRRTDAVHAPVAAEIARESRPELGSDGLAKKQGYRNTAVLIAATTGTSTGDAVRLVKVGEAIAPRTTLTGESAPARHPHVAEAHNSGRIGRDGAAAIITMLDRAALRADREDLDQAERILCDQAAGLPLDQLAKLIARAEAHLDPDGLEPRERDARGKRSLVMFERDGMIHFNGKLDIESGAPVKTAIEAVVTADMRAALDDPNRGSDPDSDMRSIPQRQADALALMARHVLGCDHNDLPLAGATLVVRMSLEDLENDDPANSTGHALIDGINQPVSISTARRMAAGGGIIPCVLDSQGEILDWGREKRLFTRAQRLALVERDGGCAMCGLPPGMTRAHHIRWWKRDHGPTDLANGVLLCESCHHRIHDNGWDIQVDGVGTRATVWFIPPRHVDPARTPRLGGRARFDYLAA